MNEDKVHLTALTHLIEENKELKKKIEELEHKIEILNGYLELDDER